MSASGASGDRISIFMTGGTIDSEYDGSVDTVVPRSNSVVPRFFAGLSLERPLEFTQLLMKDSRTIGGSDRAEIAKAIANCEARKVLVTHGSYTIAETAAYLDELFGETEQVVVLTGSLLPLDGMNMGDAGFNLGFALAQLDILEPGVYVCFKGSVFTSGEIAKLKRSGQWPAMFGDH